MEYRSFVMLIFAYLNDIGNWRVSSLCEPNNLWPRAACQQDLFADDERAWL